MKKIQILLNLPGDEIFNVCRTSKTMMQVCEKEKYDNLWQRKLLEDFNIEYRDKDAFKKYSEMASLYSRTFYAVNFLNKYSPSESTVDIFNTREDAIEYIVQEVSPIDINYFVAKRILDDEEELRTDSGIYMIDKKRLTKVNKTDNNKIEKEEHNERVEKLKSIFDLDSDIIDRYLIDIYEIIDNHTVENLSEQQIREIDSLIGDICYDSEIDEEKYIKINTFIYSIL